MLRLILKAVDGLIRLALSLALATAGAYAAYALWDNNQVYGAAANVQADMIRLKPDAGGDAGEAGPSFAQLLAINPDVCAWVTMDGTRIDHPVLQGDTNLSYINTDVYGNFALAGSIFLDTRCDRSFAGGYSLLYGHHMDSGGMFGDLDQYKEERFFDENRTGSLILPGGIHALRTFACLLLGASDDVIFQPERWRDDIAGLLEYAGQNALHVDEDAIADMRRILNDPGANAPRVLALSTCSAEFTDARTIVLAWIQDDAPAD